MTKSFENGDKVGWDSSGGHSTGKIVKKLTSPMTIKGHKVSASMTIPNIWSKTDEGKRAAHSPGPDQLRFRFQCRISPVSLLTP